MEKDISLTVEMKVLTCCHALCGMVFAVPKWWEISRRQDHSWWFCPNGHTQHFGGESDSEKAIRLQKKAELDAQASINEARHAQLVAEKERDSAIRSKRKIERRISKGVCPCCNRTFEDLHRHMSTKHKDYALPAGKDQKRIEGPVQ